MPLLLQRSRPTCGGSHHRRPTAEDVLPHVTTRCGVFMLWLMGGMGHSDIKNASDDRSLAIEA